MSSLEGCNEKTVVPNIRLTTGAPIDGLGQTDTQNMGLVVVIIQKVGILTMHGKLELIQPRPHSRHEMSLFLIKDDRLHATHGPNANYSTVQ